MHDYKYRPAPRFEDGRFIPSAPVPLRKSPKEFDWIDNWRSLFAMANNPISVVSEYSLSELVPRSRSFGRDFRVLHSKPVAEVNIQDVEAILEPIWHSNNHSARMIRGMIEQAIDLAKVLGWRSGDNPARWKGRLEHLLPNYMPKVKHHAAMPYREVPQFFAELLDSHHPTKYALAFTILTASRGHMVRHATWGEIDLKKELWVIPASRMKKSDEDHVVPLTEQMVSLLQVRESQWVFPFRGKAFSENAFRSTLKAMNLDYTAHGFRSSCKDWASDQTDYADEVSEHVLAHKVGSKVRRSYRRGKVLDKRHDLLEEWSKFLQE